MAQSLAAALRLASKPIGCAMRALLALLGALMLFELVTEAVTIEGDKDDQLTETLKQLHQEQQFHKRAADQAS